MIRKILLNLDRVFKKLKNYRLFMIDKKREKIRRELYT